MATQSANPAATYGRHSLLAAVLSALSGDDPGDALGGLFPWLTADQRDRFVVEAVPLQNAGDRQHLEIAAKAMVREAYRARPDLPARGLDRADLVGLIVVVGSAVALLAAVWVTR